MSQGDGTEGLGSQKQDEFLGQKIQTLSQADLRHLQYLGEE